MISFPPGTLPPPDGQDEIERLVTGSGRYVADLVPDSALHCWFVRSPIAHGQIVSVDVEEATRAVGVVAVYTAATLDVPDLNFALGPGPDVTGMDRPVLARDRVRFAGEAVAMVIADRGPAAEDAAGLVWTDIDPLPAVTTTAAALADDIVLFPDAGSNVVAVSELAEGPEPTGKHLIEVTVDVDHPRLAPSPLETLQMLAVPQDGRLLVWCGHQAPHQLRTKLSESLSLPEETIRVTVPDVGGAFGMKRIYPEFVAVARAALLLGRPVAWNQSRTDIFLAGTHGRSQHHKVMLTADRSGRIHRARFELTSDTGAYPQSGALVAGITRLVASGLYAIPRIEYHTTICVTNKAPTAPYRGAGRPEAALAIERAVDALAHALDLDPADVRRVNFIDTLPYRTPTGAMYDSGDYRAALDLALDLVDYQAVRSDQERRRQADQDPIGIGIGAFIERAGGGAESGEYGSVEVAGNGSITVRTGSTAAGQGHEEVWRDLVVSIFTVDRSAVTVVAGDTDAVPRGVGSFASRSAQIGASAVWRVAELARDRARDLAAELMEASPADLVLEDGSFSVVGVPGRGHVAVVEVERATGITSLRRLIAVDDVGTVLDDKTVEGQLHGSLMQGVGAALFEEVYYDEAGQPLTTSFANYVVPGAGTSLNLTAERIEHAAPSNPLGAKGAGEGGCIGAPAAILNATVDALSPYGVTDLQLPLLPHRIWEALQRADEKVAEG
jgi:carbon-monoxide dehydrogenase large subunit